MNSTLKNVIQWTLYIMIVALAIVFVFVPIGYEIFSSNSSNIDAIRKMAANSGVALGAMSVGLGSFSIYQANAGSKQTQQILETINSVVDSQKTIFSELSEIRTSIEFAKQLNEKWTKENIYE